MDLIYSVHKLETFSSNPGKVHSEDLVHILSYIRDNKNLGMKYYADMNYSLVYDILRQARIQTENKLMDFSDSSWQDCPNTGRSTRSYIIFYNGGTIDHGTYVPVPVSQPSSESDYNAACTVVMALARFRMLIHELLNKDPYIVPEEAPLIILNSKAGFFVCIQMGNIPNTQGTLQG